MKRLDFSLSALFLILTGMYAGMLLLPRLGALIGGIFGYWVWHRFIRPTEGNTSARQELFQSFEEALEDVQSRTRDPYRALCGLFMAVVRQNPRGEREIHRQTALQILHQYGRRMGLSYGEVSECLDHWKSREIPVQQLAGTVRGSFPRSGRMEFLYGMTFVAASDGRLTDDEHGVLRYLAGQFRLTKRQYERILSMVQAQMNRGRRQSNGNSRAATRSEQTLKESYETLNLDPSASLKQVKKRYRELARKYHPDRSRNNGNGSSNREQAEEKMIDINQAYQTIMDHHKT